MSTYSRFLEDLPTQEQLHAHVAACLAEHHIAVLGVPGDWLMPVRYRSLSQVDGVRRLHVDCMVPQWAGVLPRLEHNAHVLLLVQACPAAGLRWLQIRGLASPIAAPDWAAFLPVWQSALPPDALYDVLRVTPWQVDLFDERQGWGAHETLEF